MRKKYKINIEKGLWLCGRKIDDKKYLSCLKCRVRSHNNFDMGLLRENDVKKIIKEYAVSKTVARSIVSLRMKLNLADKQERQSIINEMILIEEKDFIEMVLGCNLEGGI